LKNHWCLLSLAVIVVIAFLLRTVFAYGISADGDFALSGGAVAEYHLHMVESILNGSYSLSDASVNYPLGGLNVYPPLVDFLGAFVGMILSATGMSTATAASAGLAVLNPIIGALTCIPVYLIGKELYSKGIGVVAALIFAFLALPITTSVFSSGTEYATAAFMVAFMSYFMVKMVKAMDAAEEGKKSFIIYSVLAGIFFGLAALSWNGFAILLYIPVVAMYIQLFLNRFSGKNLTDVLVGYSVVMLIGVAIAAVYYFPAGLSEQIMISPLVLAIIAIAFAAIFKALESQPWVLVIPALAIAFIVIVAVLFFATPDIYAMIFKPSIYTDDSVSGLINNRVSMSNVSAYYGWLTMWLPILLGIYEFYQLARKDRSNTKVFTAVWLLIMFFIVWTTYSNAAAVGSVFAVGSAAAIVLVVKRANFKDYWTSIKSAGFPGCFKKIIKPLPFATIIIVGLLVIVPNATYGVDAGMPNNNDPLFGENGNTQFVIKTGDSYPAGDLWEYAKDNNLDDGAIVTWLNNTYDAVSLGGFTNVTDTVGGGAVTASSLYLSEGSSGAFATMMVRLALSDDRAMSVLENKFNLAAQYLKDVDLARQAMVANPGEYGYIDEDMTDTAAQYMAAVHEIVDSGSTAVLMGVYDQMRMATGDSISYVYVDGSMLPLQYNDGNSFSTMAYVGGYTVDQYGAATQFYSYNTYYGITVYTSAMYDTFIWKALIGPSASDAGYSSSYTYLADLALSDGTAMAMPGLVEGFDVVYWMVMYNPDSRAVVSDDGWEYMLADDAIAKQKNDGGVINYLSSIMLLSYSNQMVNPVVSATIEDANGTPVSGAKMTVYAYDDYYGKDIIYSEAKSINGVFQINVPSTDYSVKVTMGSVVVSVSDEVQDQYTLPAVTISGDVMVGESKYTGQDLYIKVTSKTTGESFSDTVREGYVYIDGLVPDTYSYEITSGSGTSLGTGTLNVSTDIGDITFALKSYKITTTVKDANGELIEGVFAYATNVDSQTQFRAVTNEEGVAEIYAIPGTYSMTVGNGYTTATNSTVTISSSNRTSSLTVYPSYGFFVEGADGHILSVSAGDYTTYTISNGTVVEIPESLATDNMQYTLYGYYGDKVYLGVFTFGSDESVVVSGLADEDSEQMPVEVTPANAIKVSGTLKSGDSGVKGTVRFINAEGAVISVGADTDGKFTAALAAGEYTIYADNGSDKVYFGKKTASSDIGDLDLVDGRKITANLKYNPRTADSSSKALPFVKAFIDFTYNEVQYELIGMTNTSGAAAFYIPDNVEATVTFNNTEGTLDTAAFTCTNLKKTISSGTSNSTQTITVVAQNATSSEKNVINKCYVTAIAPMTLTFYKDGATDVPSADLKYEFDAGETLQVVVGQYDVVIDGSTGVYYKGTGYVYAGCSGLFGVDVTEVIKANIVKGANDVITVESDGEYFIDGSTYYLEVGHKFYFKSTNGDGDSQKVAYGYVDTNYAESPVTLNLTAEYSKITITGYIGVAYDGELTVTDLNGDNHMIFDISAGAYTAALPSSFTSARFYVEASTTVDGVKYTYTDFRETLVHDGDIVNFDALLDDVSESTDDLVVSAELVDADAQAIKVTITNNTNVSKSYSVSAGRALYFTTFSETVAAGATQSVTILATYDARAVSTGSDGFEITASEIGGSTSKTVKVKQAPSDMDAQIDIYTADDTHGKNDRISAYEYMYSLTFVNHSSFTNHVWFNSFEILGYGVALTDEAGLEVVTLNTGFDLQGFETKTVYIKLIPLSSDSGSVPAVTWTAHYGSGVTQKTQTAQDVEIDAGTATASGDDIYNSRSGIPVGVWILAGAAILLAIMALWLGSKRGVFSRKN
jgi:asparagine N-glycosylation enzyme membrane subunit Stt3